MALAQAYPVYTIGFTQKSAETFFGILREHGIKRLLDVRINNTSQLAGFAKRDDLRYFLRELCGADYQHEPSLAPTKTLLKAYRSGELDWAGYERAFLELLHKRGVDRTFSAAMFATPTVLLCSEATAEQCHRRLVVEYWQRCWDENAIVEIDL